MTEQQPILKVNDLTKRFGGLTAISNLSFDVREGKIKGLIGPNGAGKTTVFNMISGIYKPTTGRIFFDGHDITALKPHEICYLGVSRTFQLILPFLNETVLQNALVGVLFGKKEKITMKNAISQAERVLEQVGLSSLRDRKVNTLNILRRKQVELARALATRPKVLLLDEPLAGLNFEETKSYLRMISELNKSGMTVLLVEHNVRAIMTTCHEIVVLHHGEKIAEGTPGEVAANARVIEVYLGESVEHAS